MLKLFNTRNRLLHYDNVMEGKYYILGKPTLVFFDEIMFKLRS